MPPLNRSNPTDPFTTSTTASGLRSQPSQSSLRSNASAASTSTRTRQQRGDNLFAPTISRRPTSRTRGLDDEILADSSSEQERRRHIRSPAVKHKSRQQQAEEQDIVKRDAQGNYLLGGVELGGVGKVKHMVQDEEEEDEEARMAEINAYYSSLARKYFTSGAGVTTRRVDEDYERERPDMMYCLKAEVIQKLENERWLYEPGDRLQPGIP